MRFQYPRLSAMMFLQIFVSGCTTPILTLYMKHYLNFSGTQIGIIMAMSAVPSFLAPFIGAFIADRIISAERLLLICNLAGAALMLVFSNQTRFFPVLICFLLYGMANGPTWALTSAITCHHAPDAIKSFGGIRLWGTLGWITAAWFFSFFWIHRVSTVQTEILRSAMHLSAFSSLITAIYVLTLPTGLKRNKGEIVIIPRDSLRVIFQPEILVVSILGVVLTFTDRFYVFGGGPFVRSLGFSDKMIMPILSIGQIPEIIGLAFLGIILKKIGLKKTLLIGVFCTIIRFSVFSSGNPHLLFLGISMHGLTYSFFFTPLIIFLDNRCDKYSRAGAHQLFTIITGGVGGLAGNLLAGYTADITSISVSNQLNFHQYWLVPLILAVIGFTGIFIFLTEHTFLPSPSSINNTTTKKSGKEIYSPTEISS